MSGCTCTLAIIFEKCIYFGFIGDTLMCMSKRMNDNLENIIKNNELILTRPFHIPSNPKERIRIFNNRGEVRGDKSLTNQKNYYDDEAKNDSEITG